MLTSNTNNVPLFVRESGRRYRKATNDEVLAHVGALAYRSAVGQSMTSPRAIKDFLKTRCARLDHEIFGVIFLDNRHRVKHVEDVFRGTIDGSSVHPRDVVKLALEQAAAAVVIFHNHPSGIAEPSQADEMITERLRQALGLMDIRLLDHFVIGGDSVVSFAERGLI